MNLYDKSVDQILQNQTCYGSFIASPSFQVYHFSWIRDDSFIAYALDVAGHFEETEKFCNWVDQVVLRYADKIETIQKKLRNGEKIEKSEFLNARYTLDGFDEEENGWGNFQLDAYGTWLWLLAQHATLSKNSKFVEKYRKSVEAVITYLSCVWNYPNYDIWEENGDKIHTSTLACLYGGLAAIQEYIPNETAKNTAQRIRSYILTNCVCDDSFVKYVGSREVDASLLWVAVPFGVVDLDDKRYQNTVERIRKEITTECGVHRYAQDTYYGGGEWVLLSCWLAWQDVLAGNRKEAEDILKWTEANADEQGNLPEQVFHHMLDEKFYEEWVSRWGKPASPLLWSHAMYIVLKKALETH